MRCPLTQGRGKDGPIAEAQHGGGLAGALTQKGGNILNVRFLQRLHGRAFHLDPVARKSWLLPPACKPDCPDVPHNLSLTPKVTLKEGQGGRDTPPR